MVRSEFIVAGCILVALGLGLSIMGYSEIQATPLEQLVTIAEEVSGQKAPSQLRPPKTSGYVRLTLGLASLATGLALILRSRTPPTEPL